MCRRRNRRCKAAADFMHAVARAPTGWKKRPAPGLLCALVVLALVSPAYAEDFPYPPVPTLPPASPVPPPALTVGPATFTRWSGFYVGGQFGMSNGNADFRGSTEPGLSYALRETALENEFAPDYWQLLGVANNSAPSYGVFLGYNTQWQDLVLGVEANLNHSNFTLNAPSTPIGPLITAADTLGYTHSVTGSASGSVTNLDFATLRARAGYIVGSFMPYGFGGVALGLANVSVAATIHDDQCTSTAPITCGSYSFSNTYLKNMEVLYGFAVGAGVDVALTPNIFLRAEFEWDQFNPPPGILMTIATGRVGAGIKF
jgi:opacity protein-like surface antigen